MFKNKKAISILLTVIMVLTVAIPALAAPVDYGAELTNKPNKTYTQKFTDVPTSHWAFSYIGEMAERGVLSGYPNGYFYTENNVTRGEFAKIMTLAAGLPVTQPTTSSYADVSTSDWYSPYIETARYYLSGYTSNGANYYMPESNALREDIAVALVKLKGYDTTGFDLSILKAMFKDWQSISEGAQKYVAVAVEQGLISGYDDNTFRGQDGVNRAETATLLWRAYQYGNGNKDFEQEKAEDTNPPSPTTLPDVINDLQLTMYVGESVKQVMDEQKFSQSIFKYSQPIYESDVAENDGCLEKKPNIHNLAYAINLYFAVKPGKAVLYTPMEDASGNHFSLKTTVNVLAAKPENPTEEPGKPAKPTKEPASKKAYIVDTLAKASVSDTYKYATDDGQNLYYYDSSAKTIYQINMDSGKKSTLLNVSNLKYEEMETVTETVTKTTEKQVPKTITKEAEKEVPIKDTDSVIDENEPPMTETVIETVEETIYETVTEEITEEVTKETLKGTYTDYEVQQVYIIPAMIRCC